MNEINVSIPYSLFKECFYCYVLTSFKSSFVSAKSAIQDIKKYWILLDNETRNRIVSLCSRENNSLLAKPIIREFQNWAIDNADYKHSCSNHRRKQRNLF